MSDRFFVGRRAIALFMGVRSPLFTGSKMSSDFFGNWGDFREAIVIAFDLEECDRFML
jgi:hypothetical protein